MTGISSDLVVVCNIVSWLSSKPQKHKSLRHCDEQALNFHWQLDWTTRIHSLRTRGLHEFFSIQTSWEMREARHFQDIKESLIRIVYFSVLSLQKHLPRARATGFHPADSLCPGQDNHMVVHVETARCYWFQSQGAFASLPFKEEPCWNSCSYFILLWFALNYLPHRLW